MFSAKDLEALGVPPHVASGFVSTVFPEAGGGRSPDVRDGSKESYANQTPVRGGASPGARDNPGESYPNAPGHAGPNDPGVIGGGTDGPAPPPPIDWRTYLTDWGFPQDVVDHLTNIFRTYADPSQASAASLAYIRGTDWYTKTFPGIQEGMRNGLLNNEADYRSYVNSLNQSYRSYFNRDVTTAEVAGFLKGGTNPGTVLNHLQGQALVAANQGDWQYQLGAFDATGRASDSDLSQYGDYLGGIGNMVGPALQARLDKARQRMATIFQGSLASPSLAVLNNGRLADSTGKNNLDIAS